MRGQEWRAVVANYAEFYARSAVDWEKPTARMRELAQSPAGVAPEARWSPRVCHACVFCARMHWAEDLRSEYLAGKGCFMRSPKEVAALLSWERYHEHWPGIPADELRASSVSLSPADAQ